MSNYHGPSEVALSIETSVGAGSYQDFEAHVRGLPEIGHEQETADVTPFGVSFRKHAATGLASHPDIEIDALLDDTGTYNLFMDQLDTDPTSTGRRLTATFGDSAHTYFISVLTVNPRVAASLDDIQQLPVTLRPTDEGLWSSSTST